MSLQRIEFDQRQVILHTAGFACNSAEDLVRSHAFAHAVQAYVDGLRKRASPLIGAIPLPLEHQDGVSQLVELLRLLVGAPIDRIARDRPEFAACAERRDEIHDFIEGLYDFWREHLRFMILHSMPGPSGHDRRPYRAFNITVELLAGLVRGAYRDACENVTGTHPRVYRQVAAGCNVGLIAVPKESAIPGPYRRLTRDVPFIRQVWIDPPLILDPPMNKRTGTFQKIGRNPLASIVLDPSRFLCYPAQVGPLVVFVYFHQQFIGLGCALANLFELATDEQVAAGPHAIYVYGAPSEEMVEFGELPTVFYDDEANGILIGAVPLENRFGYFGYIKKMVLTLHNAIMIKRGRMPFHGALARMLLSDGGAATVLLIGDTATGKSESLEAFRVLGGDAIRELRIVADDMGSLEIAADGSIRGYGSEIGAFIRLDDLRQGYAFGQIDRAIIMSPQKINARVVLPVTTVREILRGYPLDYILYANNYEEADEERPVIERFASVEEALRVFREGAALSKGTTLSTGLVHSYFANPFGPPQYREAHEALAGRAFQAAFDRGIFVGQVRTRLGIAGYETRGPEEAARALLALVAARPGGPSGDGAPGANEAKGAKGTHGANGATPRGRSRGRSRRPSGG